MRYRNLITGYEFETNSICSAPDYVLVGAETPKKILPEEKKEDPKEAAEQQPKETVKKSTKKPVKRSKRK